MWQQFLYKQRYEYICILKLDTNKNVNTFLWTIGYKWIYSYDKFDTNEYLNIFVFFNFLRFYHFLFNIFFGFIFFSFSALQDGGMGTSWGRRQQSSFPVFLQMQHCISCKSNNFISSKVSSSQSPFKVYHIPFTFLAP